MTFFGLEAEMLFGATFLFLSLLSLSLFLSLFFSLSHSLSFSLYLTSSAAGRLIQNQSAFSGSKLKKSFALLLKSKQKKNSEKSFYVFLRKKKNELHMI